VSCVFFDSRCSFFDCFVPVLFDDNIYCNVMSSVLCICVLCTGKQFSQYMFLLVLLTICLLYSMRVYCRKYIFF